jgi:hypothetical protein
MRSVDEPFSIEANRGRGLAARGGSESALSWKSEFQGTDYRSPHFVWSSAALFAADRCSTFIPERSYERRPVASLAGTYSFFFRLCSVPNALAQGMLTFAKHASCICRVSEPAADIPLSARNWTGLRPSFSFTTTPSPTQLRQVWGAYLVDTLIRDRKLPRVIIDRVLITARVLLSEQVGAVRRGPDYTQAVPARRGPLSGPS